MRLGSTRRTACGRITEVIASRRESPIAAAASCCPRSTALIPARNTSAVVAEETRIIGITSIQNRGKVTPKAGRASRNA